MEVLLIADGDADVLCKRAATPEEVDRLAREADLLTESAGVPGIPAIVRRELSSLSVEAADGPSLMAAPPLHLDRIRHVALSVARTLAGLHERALVHGALCPAHVVLDGDGPPLLCGFGAGGASGNPMPDDEHATLEPETDVALWGDLVAHLLDYAEAEDEPYGAPRLRRRRERERPYAADAAIIREELAARADDARHPDPQLRPSARALAISIEHRLGDGSATRAAFDEAAAPSPAPQPRDRHRSVGLLDRLSSPDEAVTPVSPARRSPRRAALPPIWRRLVVGLVAVLLLLATPLVVTRMRPSQVSGGTASGSSAAAPPPCPPVTGEAADVDGDGCEEAVAWVEGVLHAGVARFSLGAAGDAVVVGDWDCDGRRTPALLGGGRLIVFDSWPDLGTDLVGRSLATVDGATALAVVRGPDGCERPTVRRADGADLVVEAKP